MLFGGRSHGDAYRTRFAQEAASGRLRIRAGDSHACIAQLPDGSVDAMYIDADHREEAVRRDLAAARPKVRDGGWIIVNDYLMVAALGDAIPYGVVNATNRFMIEHRWRVRYFALQTRMFCDVALRQHRVLQQAAPSVAALAAECDRLRADLNMLRRSGSWRATAPLRALSRLSGRPLRRVFGRGAAGALRKTPPGPSRHAGSARSCSRRGPARRRSRWCRTSPARPRA